MGLDFRLLTRELKYWQVVAKSDRPAFLGGLKTGSFVLARCMVRIGGKGCQLVSHVKAENEYDAEQRAMALFDAVATTLVFSKGLPWFFRMQTPVELQETAANESLLVEAVPDKVYSISGTEQIGASPLIAKNALVLDPLELEQWFDAIRGSSPWIGRLAQYYRRGVALAQNLPEEAFLCFFKIVEAFAERYRKLFEEDITGRGLDIEAFQRDFYATLRKHLPRLSDKKLDQIFSHVRSRLLYTNRELMEFLCRKSGYFETVLGRRKSSLKDLIEDVYGYLSPERRQQEFEDTYGEHERYLTTVTPKLPSVRPAAAHFTKEPELPHSAVRDCALLAHYLIIQEIRQQGNVVPERS